MHVRTYVYMYVCNIVVNSPRTVIRRSNSGAGEIFRAHQTGLEAHQSFYTIGTRSIFRGYSGHGTRF